MKKILIILSIIILNSCITPTSEGDKMLYDVPSNCSNELGVYESKLKECHILDNHERYLPTRECLLYDDNINYTDEEFDKMLNCLKIIKAKTCEEIENTSSIDDFEGCHIFKGKPKKSKIDICTENYMIYCTRQTSCEDSERAPACKEAKYIATNSSGKDAHIAFKEDILRKYCDNESDEDAIIEDLDCLIGSHPSIECDSIPSFEEYRVSCDEIE